MAERSFAGEVRLRAGEGDIVRGEGILAITKRCSSRVFPTWVAIRAPRFHT